MNPLRTSLRLALPCSQASRAASSSSSRLRTAIPTFHRPPAHVVARRRYATRESMHRDKAQIGPATWQTALLFIVTGVGLYFYFEREKEKVREKKHQINLIHMSIVADQAVKTVGKPLIGGPFSLLDADGKPFTDQDLRGKWALMYFGFTHCPDICPEELDKMGEAVEQIEKTVAPGSVLPVFISVDPARDSPAQVKHYIRDFHPRMIGLTGDYESVKQACKSYRVYFSSPPSVKPGEDYLVDHSIFFYLMDPLGQFVDAFGKITSAHEVATKTQAAIAKWEGAGGNAAAGV